LQIVGTLEAALVYMATAWWLLTGIKNICNTDVLPPNSPWTCPGDRVFYDASVIWGLVGPLRIFGKDGLYEAINWSFLLGAVSPIPVWLASRRWPKVGWIRAINMPILIGATGVMPPATSINYTSWILVGFIFNYVIYRRKKAWWSKYNYVLSASLDAGTAVMGVAIYFVLGLEQKNINWWGVNVDNCPLATCPTQAGLGQPDNPNCPST
jgi:OPT family oligopeptide transporter